MEDWKSVKDSIPPDGIYEAKVIRGDERLVMQKKCIKGRWFGGCRPFSENDAVTHYRSVRLRETSIS